MPNYRGCEGKDDKEIEFIACYDCALKFGSKACKSARQRFKMRVVVKQEASE